MGIHTLFCCAGILLILASLDIRIKPWTIKFPKGNKLRVFFIGVLLLSTGLYLRPEPIIVQPTSIFCQERSPNIKNPYLDPYFLEFYSENTPLPTWTELHHLDDTFRNSQHRRIYRKAADSALILYKECCGITPRIFNHFNIVVDSLVFIYSERTCLNSNDSTVVYEITYSFPKDPLGLLSIPMPTQEGSIINTTIVLGQEVLPEGIRFDPIRLAKGDFKLSAEDKFRINLFAQKLLTIDSESNHLKITCGGFTSEEKFKKGHYTEYTKKGRWDKNSQAIPLAGNSSYFPLIPNKIDTNESLSYARAYEGLTCLIDNLKRKKGGRAFVSKHQFLYQGNGVDTKYTSDEQQRRITFNITKLN